MNPNKKIYISDVTLRDGSHAIRHQYSVENAKQIAQALDAAKGRVVELRYFGGLTIEETAEAMELSPATVKRHWQAARAWLFDALSDGPRPPVPGS